MDNLNNEVCDLARGYPSYYIQLEENDNSGKWWNSVQSHSGEDISEEDATAILNEYRRDYPEINYRLVKLSGIIIK